MVLLISTSVLTMMIEPPARPRPPLPACCALRACCQPLCHPLSPCGCVCAGRYSTPASASLPRALSACLSLRLCLSRALSACLPVCLAPSPPVCLVRLRWATESGAVWVPLIAVLPGRGLPIDSGGARGTATSRHGDLFVRSSVPRQPYRFQRRRRSPCDSVISHGALPAVAPPARRVPSARRVIDYHEL